MLVKTKEPSFANKEKANAINITSWEPFKNTKVFTREQLTNMSQTEYNKVMELKEKWKVVIR
jgi:hypothetical protein